MSQGPVFTVVIVEDHAMVAESLAVALDADPELAVVGTAATAEDGLRLVVDHQPDVVLMDLLLPDGDGATATAAIRRLAPETRVLLITSATGQDVLVRAIDAGCSGMLSKTEPVARLRTAIRLAAEGEAVFAADELTSVLGRLSGGARERVGLSHREQEVLALLAQGLTTESIADQLVLSIHTVRNHIRNVMAKVDAHSRLEAVAIALRDGLL